MNIKSLKDKVLEFSKKLISHSKTIIKMAVEYTVAVAVILALSLCVLKLPEVHNKYLRHSVGSKVYTIRDSAKSGGGTGFAIKAPSGESYILTNDHVCDVSKDKQTVLVTGDEGSMRRRIIAHDENSDLCLIEGMPGVEGLSPANWTPSLGDTVNVVGHPRLLPKHVSSGEVIGTKDVRILMGPISIINPNTGKEEPIKPEHGGVLAEQCSMNKHTQEWVDIDLLFFVLKVKFCILNVKDAYISTATIHKGNSGSPVVNFWGNVIGVAFASDDTNWGRLVSLQDIKAFLKNF